MKGFCGERLPMIGPPIVFYPLLYCIAHNKDKTLKVFHHFASILPVEAELFWSATWLQYKRGPLPKMDEPGGLSPRDTNPTAFELDLELTPRET